MPRKISRLLLFSILLQGCVSSKVIILWKADSPQLAHYNKVMVVGIIRETDDSLRAQAERRMVNELTTLGYYAVSSLQEFGRYGLSDIGEEATYLKLCDNGIDAVITLALIDGSARAYQKKALNEKHTYSFYYNRIWSYRKIQHDTSTKTPGPQYVWESILFDLSSLQPQSVLQIKDMASGNSQEVIRTMTKCFINKMLKEKIIEKQQKLPGFSKPGNLAHNK